MNICTNRLETFTQHEPSWPYSNDDSYHTPEEFANAGFYNVSTKRIIDKVQCYLCSTTLAEWKQGQSPLGRHAHAAKTCPLVLLNFPDALTTIPIEEHDANTHPESEFMVKTRLKTFTKGRAWPPSPLVTDNTQQSQSRHSTKQRSYPTATKMAEAGFVFLPTLNEPDRVKCPYCQCCLSNFNAASNPWSQHLRANPGCLYVTRWRATLPVKRSSLPQKRTIPTGASATTSKKSRRATTNSNEKENTAKSVDDHNETPGTDNNINDAGNLSRFDDSIWDIAKAQLEYKPPPDLTAAKRRRPSNAKPLVTYERKKQKRPSKVLPPELTKPTASSSSNAHQSKDKTATTSRSKKQQATSHQKQTLTALPAVGQPIPMDETPAQVLARLQKRPIESSTPRDKGKGRASDFASSGPLDLPSPPSTTTKLSRDSLRLSSDKKTATGRSSSSELAGTTSSAAVATAATVSAATTTESTSYPASFMTSEPISMPEKPYRFLASTPSSQRHSNLGSSTPLPHSTPIHSRIDHGNDLMALTLSPIRGAGNTEATANGLDGVFGSLETPMTTNNRTGQQTELDISKQIEQRFRAKRRLGSPPLNSTPLSLLSLSLSSQQQQQQQQQQRNENEGATLTTQTATTKASDTDYSTGTPLLDFSGTDNEDTGTGKAPGTHLTDEQLAMTVEEYIQSLVENKVAIVKQHGEQLIKNIQQEVADTKKSILTNHL